MNIKVLNKKIGDVNVLELIPEGGRSTVGFEARLKEFNAKYDSHGLIVNAESIVSMEPNIAKSIVRTIEQVEKGAIIAGSEDTVAALERERTDSALPIFKERGEATMYFASEFAGVGVEEIPERRRADRIEVVLPLYAYFNHDDSENQFFSIVTNLSQMGLFARFLDSKSESVVREKLDPYDLKLVNLSLIMPDHIRIEVEGKLMRYDSTDHGIGVEFYKMDSQTLRIMDSFIKNYRRKEKRIE